MTGNQQSIVYRFECGLCDMLASHGGICTNGLKNTEKQTSEDT